MTSREAFAEYQFWRKSTWISFAVTLVLVVAVGLVPVPYLMLSPGPMYNTIGDVDGVPMISITDTKTYPTTGQLDMTTVTERGGPFGELTIPEVLFGWIHPNNVVAPVSLFYSPETTKAEANEEGTLDRTSSQSSAIAAALTELKIPVTTSADVVRVEPDGPSVGKVEVGDVIQGVNGTAIRKSADLPLVIREMKPGSTAQFTLDRQGQEVRVAVTVAASPSNPKWGYVGISTSTEYRGPFPITFSVEGVGGPSAGMMFSLAIIDKLTPTNLADGRAVAGTGTIDVNGNVGPIGGIAQKLYAARSNGSELFLAPAANCESVLAADAGINIAKVATLSEAVGILEKWRAGDPNLPRC